ncbi:MAG: prepilin peptidase [Synergistaceae bacterium]|jgi:leader peptidase (prepilin peptidase)/N-methyltransferase|nr:prepilin peptidase [Synergistaceae bacterium]
MDAASRALHVAFSAMLGACLGSFLNVVAHRSVIGRPWWGAERSVCENCGRVLTLFELVPVVSWVVLRGKCRGCGAAFSLRYLAVELTGAVMAGVLAWRWGIGWAYLLSMIAAFGLFLNSLTDFETGYVFDSFAAVMAAAGLIARAFGGWWALLDGLIGAAAGWGVVAVIILASRGGMGWGDAFLMAGVGALLGWKMALISFYLGLMCGAVAAVWLMLRGKVKWGRHDAIPLVPYLALGGLLTLLWGPRILAFMGNMYIGKPFRTDWPF